MSVTPASIQSFSPIYFIPNLFSLSLSQKTSHTHITMKLFTQAVNTRVNPLTTYVLRKNLPSVLTSMCFNDANLPFAQEVKNTEIGHLFEHILLEYLCQYKLLKGCNEAIYNGNTHWNWKRDEWGTFHIIVDSGKEDADILPLAIEKSIDLIKKILKKDLYFQAN